MNIKTGKYFTLLSMLALLVACSPMNPRTSVLDVEARHAAQHSKSDLDHDVLAGEYEALAAEMQAKAQEQVAIFEHKPRANSFGRNARNIRSHIAYRVREYEQVAQESTEKAAYHRKIAAKMNESNQKMNKATKKSESHKNSL